MNSQFIQIHWTSSSLEEARRIARYLVQERLVACANIIPWVESIFIWKDQLEVQQETKVIFKTIEDQFETIKKIILENAKYEVPEILKIPITGGNETYLQWVGETIKRKEAASLA